MKLALGTVQLGLTYGIANKIGKPEKADAMDLLRNAYEGGIRLYDTAAGYGDSENIIGTFKQEAGAENILIATKTGSLHKRGVASAELQAVIGKDIKQSLQNLQQKKIDYYLLHNAEDLFFYGQGILDALEVYRQEGFVRKIGISIYNPADVRELLRYKQIDQVQVPFNILDTRLLQTGLLEELQNRAIEVHGRSIYLQGLLTMAQEDIPQKLIDVKPYMQRLSELAKDLRLTRGELAFLYARDCGLIENMIVGCETQAQLTKNLVLSKMPPLPKEVYREVLHYFSSIPEKIINPALWG